jgi:hypothetical protein
MGMGFNQMNRIQPMQNVTSAATTPVTTPQPTRRVSLGSRGSGRSISGATFQVPVAKRAKTKKEPLCDCGMPISQCKCDGHDHKVKAKKSKRATSVKKAAPPDYTSIFGGAVQNYANRLKAKQKTYTPPPLYPQTYGATVNIGNDGGLSGYTSFYNAKGSKNSAMQKSITRMGRHVIGGYRGKSIAKARNFGSVVRNIKNMGRSKLDDAMLGLASRYNNKQMYDAIGNPRKMLRQVANIEGKKLLNRGEMMYLTGKDRVKTAVGNKMADAIANIAGLRYGRGSREMNRINQFRANPKDKSWRGNPSAMIGRIKQIEGERLGRKINDISNMTLGDVYRGAKNKWESVGDTAYGMMENVINQNLSGVARRVAQNRKLANTVFQGINTRRLAEKSPMAIFRVAMDTNQGRRLKQGTKLLGAGLASVPTYNTFQGDAPVGGAGMGMKKSITRMGRHVIGGYHGKSISKAIKSSQTHISQKYM